MLTFNNSVLSSLTIHFIIMGRLVADSVSISLNHHRGPFPVQYRSLLYIKIFVLVIFILAYKILSCGFSWKLKTYFLILFVKNFVLLLRPLGCCLIKPGPYVEEFLYFLLPKLKWWIICEIYRKILYQRRIKLKQA